MEVLYPCCAGLDVHKDTVVACVRKTGANGHATHEVKTFGTTTPDLYELASWLDECGVTHAVMESTGVYWRPVWNILQGGCELILTNARHVKNVPGRKTDVSDSMWLSDLLAHGLVKASFVPDEDFQTVRDLNRTRIQLVRERSRHIQRLYKVLEGCNIKLSSVITDATGKTATGIINGLINKESEDQLLEHVDPRIKAPRDQIRKSLAGKMNDLERFQLQIHQKMIEELTTHIKEIESRVDSALGTFQDEVERVSEVPGFDVISANNLLGEIGVDMSRFATDDHLVSWARMCPRADESAGRKRDTRTQKGARWVKTTLVQAAHSAIRKKSSYFKSMYERIKPRRGHMRAIVAVASALLKTIYHMLKNKTEYKDLGYDYQANRRKPLSPEVHVRRLMKLGYDVTITLRHNSMDLEANPA